MTHFTYAAPKRNNDLLQGNVLKRSSRLEKVLEKFHPYFLKEDYQYFMVITQSCDLVRRGKQDEITAKYISLAAVRPLHLVLEREIEKYQSGDLLKKTRAISEKSKDNISNFLKRLLNNNVPEYFYLHPDLTRRIPTPVCAFLRLTVPLHIKHYDVCRAARIACLASTFEAKLGWMVGNLYSRVGTDDWVPNNATDEEWKELINDNLNKYVVTLPESKLKLAAKKIPAQEVAALDEFELRNRILSILVPKKKDEVIAAVLKELSSVLQADLLTKSEQRLRNSAVLAGLLQS